MKYIGYILLGCLIASTAVAADPSGSQTFQIREILDQSSTNADQMTLVRKAQGAERKEILFVSKTVLLDQADLLLAEVKTNTPVDVPEFDKYFGAKTKPDLTPQIEIDITFTKEGAQRLADITQKNIGKRLAFVMNGQIYSAPTIASEITGGKAAINGSFSPQEASEIVAKITRSLQK